MKLTRSAYIVALQCLERLYLRYYPTGPSQAPDLSQRMFVDQSRRVQALAFSAFPGGVRLTWRGAGEAQVAEQTAELVRNQSVKGIYEGAFEYDDVIVRVDILERLDSNSWRLIEIKSSAGVKEQHLHELALQKYVLQGCGMDVAAACILHLNRLYRYEAGDYDLERLFILRDLTSSIAPYERRVIQNLPLFRSIIQSGAEPHIMANSLCNRPNRCEYYLNCESNGLVVDSVKNLPESGPDFLADLSALGIERIGDIPEDFPLNNRQQRARRSLLAGKAVFDKGLTGEMERLRYPLLFLDFEALSPALPRFHGMHPFDSLPFQWSVQRVESQGGNRLISSFFIWIPVTHAGRFLIHCSRWRRHARVQSWHITLISNQAV